MTGTTLPSPTGTPQLVVTHKEALIVDAHVPDKVLLRVRVPKEGSICSRKNIVVRSSPREGSWTLTLLENRTIYCSYSDEYARGFWRAELLPRGHTLEGKTMKVLALSTGFHSTEQLMESRIFLFVGVLATFSLMVIFAGLVNQNITFRLFDLRDEITTLKIFASQGKPSSAVPPQKEEDKKAGWQGPQGVQGEQGNVKEEVLPYLYTKDTMKPGTQLKNDESLILGDFRLSVHQCILEIEGTAPDWDRDLDGYHTVGDKPMDGACVLAMQHDGNLVMYHPEKGAVWASREKLAKLCPLGVTVTTEGELACQVKQEDDEKEKVYTTDAMMPGNEIVKDRIKLGDYKLGLQDCSIIMFGPPPKGDRVIANVPGMDGCRLDLFPDGNLVLYTPEKGALWSSIKDRKMEPCKKGMTVNKDGFLICVK